MPSIGVDAGTSAVKAVLFDDDWTCLRTATVAVEVRRPHPGWSEQDPEAVWTAVAAVVREVAAGVQVDAVSVTGQGDGCWLVDRAGRPVRPAMLWNDARATDEVDRWDRDGLLDEAFDRTGSWGFAGLAHAQLAWLATHEPQAAADAATLLSCGSWLNLRLTGRSALDVSDASNPFLAADGSGYAGELLDRLGLGWVQPLLPDVVSGRERVVPLTAAAAAELGLRAGTPVVLAPYDVVTTAIGSGAVGPTSAMAVLGTTLAVGVVAPDAQLGRQRTGSALDLGLDGRWMLLYGTLAGTEVLDWTQRLLGLPSVAALVALAGTATPGRGPLVLPYLSPAGERTPFRDPLARGAVLGLDLEQQPADIALSVLEGLTLAVADCLDASGTPARHGLGVGRRRAQRPVVPAARRRVRRARRARHRRADRRPGSGTHRRHRARPLRRHRPGRDRGRHRRPGLRARPRRRRPAARPSHPVRRGPRRRRPPPLNLSECLCYLT